MSRKEKKWLKSYPSTTMLVKIFLPSLFSYIEVGDRQKSEEMPKKLSQCWKVTDDGLCYLPSWTLLNTLFSYMEVGDEEKSKETAKKLSQCW